MIPEDWIIPQGVHIAFTDRHGGVSQGPYASMNLGEHVEDDPIAVSQNRQLLKLQLALPDEPHWLTQVHGTEVVNVDSDANRQADGAYSESANTVLVVMTADCLPVLLCDSKGHAIAALHAGWRGLCYGVLEAGVQKFLQRNPHAELFAYLGPAIGPKAFEVGAEVREAFTATTTNAEQCFTLVTHSLSPQDRGTQSTKYLANLVQLARLRLQAAGVQHIYSLEHCTYMQAERYFSYRREPITGRMASLIWRDE